MWIYFPPLICIVMMMLDTTAALTTSPSPECPSGRFGENCSYPCGHCRDALPCDVVTGVCPNGCIPNWHGQRCFQECPSGRFGENCSLSCGNCRDGLPCDFITGECPNGCFAGFHGPRCLDGCDNGFYGDDCILRCGFCLGRCDPITGFCPGGCQEGWLGRFCLQSPPLPEIKSLLYRSLSIVGAVVGVISIFSICLCVYHCWVADRKLPDKEEGLDSVSVHSGHAVSASTVMMRNLTQKSRTLNQLYSVFSWGSDFDEGDDRRQQPKAEAGALYANGQITLGGSGLRLSQEVPPPAASLGRDPLYQNSDPVEGKYQNWTT